MRIMIVGAGSLGLLFAAKLAALCEQLTVVTRTREQAAALTDQGIELTEAEMSLRCSPKMSIQFDYYIEEEKAEGLSKPSYDYIFLMVKQPAITKKLANYLRDQMSEQTHLVSFQNGIGHEEMLGDVLHSHQMLLAVTTEGARKEGYTRVAHTGFGVTYIGSTRQKGDCEPSSHILLVELLEKAGFHTEMSKNMDVRIWSKLIINAVINPLTAILRVKNGELLHSAWTRTMMEALYKEACTVANTKGVVLPDTLWDTILEVCSATSRNHSSMLQDIENGRPTEIDRINGSLLAIAAELNLEIPTHRTVYYLVKALE